MTKNDMTCLKIEKNFYWVPNKTNDSFFYLDITFPVGLLSENQESLEYSHLIEHLFANHTSEKYPNSKENYDFLKSSGIMYNATTFMQSTSYVYYGGCTKLAKTLDLVLNTIVGLKLAEDDVKREKYTCTQELVEHQSDEYRNTNLSSKLLYGEHRENITISEQIDSIKNATILRLNNFFADMYDKNNMCVTIFSTFDHAKYLQKELAKIQKGKSQSTIMKNYWNYKQPINTQEISYISNGKQITNTSQFNKFDVCLIKNTQTVIQEEEIIQIRHSINYMETFLNNYLTHVLRNEKNLVYYVEVMISFTKLNELNKKNIEMIIKSTSNSKENSLEIIKVVDECIRQSKIIPITEPIIQKIVETQKHTVESSIKFRDVVDSVSNRAINLINTATIKFHDGNLISGFSESEVDNNRLECHLSKIHPAIHTLLEENTHKFVYCYV